MSHPAVVSRNPNQLDAFVVDSAGGLHTSWWTPIDDWTDHGWRDITLGLPPLPGGAPVAVVSRNPNQLDAFVVDSAGRLHTSWWTPTDDWTDHAWRDITAMALGPPSPVSHSVP